jgi:hypothetical protein
VVKQAVKHMNARILQYILFIVNEIDNHESVVPISDDGENSYIHIETLIDSIIILMCKLARKNIDKFKLVLELFHKNQPWFSTTVQNSIYSLYMEYFIHKMDITTFGVILDKYERNALREVDICHLIKKHPNDIFDKLNYLLTNHPTILTTNQIITASIFARNKLVFDYLYTRCGMTVEELYGCIQPTHVKSMFKHCIQNVTGFKEYIRDNADIINHECIDAGAIFIVEYIVKHFYSLCELTTDNLYFSYFFGQKSLTRLCHMNGVEFVTNPSIYTESFNFEDLQHLKYTILNGQQIPDNEWPLVIHGLHNIGHLNYIKYLINYGIEIPWFVKDMIFTICPNAYKLIKYLYKLDPRIMTNSSMLTDENTKIYQLIKN